MVKSGLTSRIDVSPYRLAAHLALASVLLISILWIVLGLASPARRIHGGQAYRALLLVMLTLVQIVIGGFMAGIDAGLVTASWPDIDGKFVPDGLFVMSPWWRNLFENALTVQFNHRLAAYLIAVFSAVHMYLVYRSDAPPSVVRSGVALLVVVVVQFCLGVATLMTAVPLQLALMHQAGALLLLAAAVFHLHVLTREGKGSSGNTRRLLRGKKFR
jgi:cytochrome c oxidase assembly protein subunit 15